MSKKDSSEQTADQVELSQDDTPTTEMSDEELAAALFDTDTDSEDQPTAVEATDTGEEITAEETDEVEAAATEDTDEDTETAETDDAEDEPTELEEIKHMVKDLQHDNEIQRLKAEKWEKIAQRESGRAGYLNKQLQDGTKNGTQQDRADETVLDFVSDGDDTSSAPTHSVPKGAEQYLAKVAAQNGVNSFANNHPDVVGNEQIVESMAEFIPNYRNLYENALSSGDPDEIERAVENIYEAALIDVKLKAEQAKRELSTKNKERRASDTVQKKKDLTASKAGKTGGTRRVTPPSDMSRSEMKKLSDQELSKALFTR